MHNSHALRLRKRTRDGRRRQGLRQAPWGQARDGFRGLRQQGGGRRRVARRRDPQQPPQNLHHPSRDRLPPARDRRAPPPGHPRHRPAGPGRGWHQTRRSGLPLLHQRPGHGRALSLRRRRREDALADLEEADRPGEPLRRAHRDGPRGVRRDGPRRPLRIRR